MDATKAPKAADGDSTIVVSISDIHGLHLRGDIVDVPHGDVLVIAGDIEIRSSRDVQRLEQWLASLPHPHKVVGFGNMDIGAFDAGPGLRIKGAQVVVDRVVEVAGLRLMASPWSPKYAGVWQLEDEAAGQRHWSRLLPPDLQLDVLVTHTPPYGYGDLTRGRHVGDKQLLDAVQCLAEHVWRQQSRPRPSCPICRQPMRTCAPWQLGAAGGGAPAVPAPLHPTTSLGRSGSGPSHAGSAELLLPLQVGRVRFQVRLKPDQGRIQDVVCGLFKLHPSRVKLVLRGRCLDSEEQLREAAAAGAAVVLLGSRGKAATGPGLWCRLLTWLYRLGSHLLRWWVQSAALQTLAAPLRPLGDILRAFLVSLNPGYQAPPPPTPTPTQQQG